MNSDMTLNNNYYVLRHGHSLANQQHIIVSDIRHGQYDYGLSPMGIVQVNQTLASWSVPVPDYILHSDFKRTVETASIAADYFNCDVELSAALRERYFGVFELTDDSHYPLVWQQDQLAADHQFGQVESLQSVCDRQIALLKMLETQMSQKNILLVGHGDPLQILLTYFLNKPLSEHRQLTPLATAEVREVMYGF